MSRFIYQNTTQLLHDDTMAWQVISYDNPYFARLV